MRWRLLASPDKSRWKHCQQHSCNYVSFRTASRLEITDPPQSQFGNASSDWLRLFPDIWYRSQLAIVLGPLCEGLRSQVAEMPKRVRGWHSKGCQNPWENSRDCAHTCKILVKALIKFNDLYSSCQKSSCQTPKIALKNCQIPWKSWGSMLGKLHILREIQRLLVVIAWRFSQKMWRCTPPALLTHTHTHCRELFGVTNYVENEWWAAILLLATDPLPKSPAIIKNVVWQS